MSLLIISNLFTSKIYSVTTLIIHSNTKKTNLKLEKKIDTKYKIFLDFTTFNVQANVIYEQGN